MATFTRRLPAGLNGGLVSMLRRGMFIVAEPTPNPDSVMFYPSARDVLGPGTKTKQFKNKFETNDSPLAAALFKVHGVHEVHLAQRHVTVTKSQKINWDHVQPSVELVMSQFFASGLQPVKEHAIERVDVRSENVEPGSLEASIMELLTERVQPFVQQDGGDVEFDHFDRENGVLWLRMSGSCKGCPKSSVTLQFGIQKLFTHFIPEVKEVCAVEDDDDE
eukprot:gnl/TRDRNA2_/TRDRNA2_83868_c0_seq1.p1 gnl/TRDRNA2_/TRDRNA2_83868_c0~~gnl/TRDRNA2_/TRDRNA2_83868_c0_seq1.p1  ORF type:complete len:220 (+),score=45.73 gnl/TRDRNA2_/TRDRNA2_83868_c0_seq1:35-694(+)